MEKNGLMTPQRSEIELVPSDDALEAAAEFGRLLASKSPPLPGDEGAYEGTWDAIVEAGWLEIGEPADDATLTLVDLLEFAELWGYHLVPAPFITSVIARRHPDEPAGALERFRDGRSYSISAPDQPALTPFGADAGDLFAPSLPLAVGQEDGGSVAGAVRHDTIVMRAAECVGAARRCLELAVPYAMTREAYGKPIGKFQALRHRLVDMHVKIEVSRGLMTLAIASSDDALEAARLVASAAREVVEGTIQVHGANGFTWEFPMHRYLRHVMAIEKTLRFAAGR